MNGLPLALGAVGALALAGRAGSRNATNPGYRVTSPTSGVFTGPVRLYRVLDAFELALLADRYAVDPGTRVEGGTYSVPAERAGGAAFTTDREAAVRFGLHHRKRLVLPLTVIEVDGTGRAFTRLSLFDHAADTRGNPLCGTGLGCNVAPRIDEVIAAWSVQPDSRTTSGALTPVNWKDALRAARTGRAIPVADALATVERAGDEVEALRQFFEPPRGDVPWYRVTEKKTTRVHSDQVARLARAVSEARTAVKASPWPSLDPAWIERAVERLPNPLPGKWRAATRGSRSSRSTSATRSTRLARGTASTSPTGRVE